MMQQGLHHHIESDQYSGSGTFTSINFPSLSVNVISVSICIISSVLYSAFFLSCNALKIFLAHLLIPDFLNGQSV